MDLCCGALVLKLGANGNIASLAYKGRELLADGASDRPLLTLRLLDDAGLSMDITSMQAEKTDLIREGDGCRIRYQSLGGLPLHVDVYADVCPDGSMTEWRAAIDNNTGYIIEYLDFPEITVCNDLPGAGGEGVLFWPAMEGVLVEDALLRDTIPGLEYKPVGYPSKGWEGLYPGPAPMQFMAYYHPDGGLYLASHDPYAHTKAIEWHPVYRNGTAFGIRMEYRLFLSVDKHSRYTMDFPMVIGALEGDWMQAAAIYRDWITASAGYLPPKLADNTSMPGWFEESPLIATYPVRGEKDTGQMEPNGFFPYTRALPALDALAEKTGCRILSLLMHWEGTAPWAPPFVWPPYGGETMFQQFVQAMHERDNLVGVYASGMGWTDESVLWPSYSMKRFREENGLDGIMCRAPDGSLPHSLICNGPIRRGYDMCPACEKTQDMVVKEVEKVLDAGVDYLQYFDQNLGGAPCLCYSRDHGHIGAPGRWQAEAMEKIYKRLDAIAASKDSRPLLGCEAAAAEPFIRHLGFNDLRYTIPFAFAKPVPAYAFVFHEYAVNFMGNHNTFSLRFPTADNPDSLLFRAAYSFAAGDMLTVVLKDNGEIHWDWDLDWDTPAPDQEAIQALIRNLSAMRRGAGKPYLHYGRMLQPAPVENAGTYTLRRGNGSSLRYPQVLYSRWRAPDGRQAQIFANYAHEPRTIGIQAAVKAVTSADGAPSAFSRYERGAQVTVPPLSSVCVELAVNASTDARAESAQNGARVG